MTLAAVPSLARGWLDSMIVVVEEQQLVTACNEIGWRLNNMTAIESKQATKELTDAVDDTMYGLASSAGMDHTTVEVIACH